MTNDEILSQIIKDVKNKLFEVYPLTKFYVGKTDDIKRREKEHKANGIFYTLPLVTSSNPEIVSYFEERMIKELTTAYPDRILNNSDKSTGNNNAHILYISFDGNEVNDELGEYDEDAFLGQRYSFHLDENVK